MTRRDCDGAGHRTTTKLADLPFKDGYIPKGNVPTLLDELFFQRAVQSYLWALPALNMYGMKEGSEKVFGNGYNVLPIFKHRLNAKTLITTPNSDVIYALGYLDLKEDGPMVIEVPPGLQGILDDFWQRPICSVGEIDGRSGAAMSVCPAPTRARAASTWSCRRTTRARSRRAISPTARGTYGVFVFWRGFFKDPKQLEGPVRVMEQTRIYPARQEGKRQADAVPQRLGRPGQHALSAGRHGVRHARRGSSSTNTSIPPTWRCAAWSRRSAS